jgi:uncharacterized protein YndB with AHSA1/START domain
MSTPGDKVRVTVVVEVEPALAFQVFTEEIDQWWRRGPRYRVAGRQPGVLQLEPRAGGRVFESYGEHGGIVHEVGRIIVWEPPSRLVFEWRAVNFAPGETTTVEVQFTPAGAGTQVTLEHRGWAALPADHPARHGLAGAAFVRMMGMWWGELLTSLREHAMARP